jgi:hypothetical protein
MYLLLIYYCHIDAVVVAADVYFAGVVVAAVFVVVAVVIVFVFVAPNVHIAAGVIVVAIIEYAVTAENIWTLF